MPWHVSTSGGITKNRSMRGVTPDLPAASCKGEETGSLVSIYYRLIDNLGYTDNMLISIQKFC